MVKIITIPTFNDSTMNKERERILPKLKNPEWEWACALYDGTPEDHLANLADEVRGHDIEFLELNCHGNPGMFDAVYGSTVTEFGRALALLSGFSRTTSVYLDACNSGLMEGTSAPIAQRLADAAGCTVYAPKGFMSGTFAERNENCVDGTAEIPHHVPYPGAQNAKGNDVWARFEPRDTDPFDIDDQRTVTITVDMKGQIATTLNVRSRRRTLVFERRSLTLHMSSHDAFELQDFLDQIRTLEEVRVPHWRMAADTTINLIHDDSVSVLGIYANGSLIKNEIEGRIQRVRDPRALREVVRRLRFK